LKFIDGKLSIGEGVSRRDITTAGDFRSWNPCSLDWL